MQEPPAGLKKVKIIVPLFAGRLKQNKTLLDCTANRAMLRQGNPLRRILSIKDITAYPAAIFIHGNTLVCGVNIISHIIYMSILYIDIYINIDYDDKEGQVRTMLKHGRTRWRFNLRNFLAAVVLAMTAASCCCCPFNGDNHHHDNHDDENKTEKQGGQEQ